MSVPASELFALVILFLAALKAGEIIGWVAWGVARWWKR